MKAGGNVVAFEIIGGIEAGRNFLDKKNYVRYRQI
jgi:hypothetical protein